MYMLTYSIVFLNKRLFRPNIKYYQERKDSTKFADVGRCLQSRHTGIMGCLLRFWRENVVKGMSCVIVLEVYEKLYF